MGACNHELDQQICSATQYDTIGLLYIHSNMSSTEIGIPSAASSDAAGRGPQILPLADRASHGHTEHSFTNTPRTPWQAYQRRCYAETGAGAPTSLLRSTLLHNQTVLYGVRVRVGVCTLGPRVEVVGLANSTWGGSECLTKTFGFPI